MTRLVAYIAGIFRFFLMACLIDTYSFLCYRRHSFYLCFMISRQKIHQTVDKKLFSPPRRGRIALSANERIAEFLDFAIQVKIAYVNKQSRTQPAFLIVGKL